MASKIRSSIWPYNWGEEDATMAGSGGPTSALAPTPAAGDWRAPKPPWLKVRFPGGPNYIRLKNLMRSQALHTVCEEAHCPNVGECWEAGTATFLILGDICTRACGYCAITTGRPQRLDLEEPLRVAQAVQSLELAHAVVTSVDRDDQPDGGAKVFADTIQWIRRLSPKTTVEVLIPDFLGNWDALATVMAAQPEILNHNTETVPRLYRRARPKGSYARAMELLRRAKLLDPETISKSGIMVGLGETRAELSSVLRDLRSVDCDVLTVGQYLRPSSKHLPMERYYTPEEFAEIGGEARGLGFKHVESGPLVRSSYHAERQAEGSLRRRHVSDGGSDTIPLYTK
jgi:lipoic acid synthetase